MPRQLRGIRYLTPKNASLARFITEQLPYLDYYETVDWYKDIVPKLDNNGKALLGCNDRYFLFTGLLGRKDGLHPWLFDRCREVEKDPDGHIDLWSRFHYKSSILTFAGVIQEILCNPEIKIVIFSVTKPIAYAFLGQISTEFETNELLRAVYHDVVWKDPKKEAPKWSLMRGLVVKRKGNPKEATVEAHGLIDGQPTSRHFDLQVYDDVVTQDYLSPDSIKKTTERWEMADNLGSHLGVRKWIAGTRYCTIGSMRVLMGDWTHKPIEDVKTGDTVVGWELRDGKRYLRAAKVVNCGMHPLQPVNKYHLENGRDVVCTEDHKWWRGPFGTGPEYSPLKLPNGSSQRDETKMRVTAKGGLVKLREVLIPTEVDKSRDAAWLAGFYDGEGSFRKNTNHPSGVITLSQTMHNPGLIDEVRRVLAALNFSYSEHWFSPSEAPPCPSKPHQNQAKWKDRCVFSINGGWRDRYRFIAQIAPVRRDRIAETLFGHLRTDQVKLMSIEPAGNQDVYWLETETGNYVVEGYCSSNSFADTYGVIIRRGSLKPRIYPATEDGTLTGVPVFLSQARWEEVKNTQRSTVSAQMLLNPIAGNDATFNTTWLRTYEVFPSLMNVYIICDPSKGASARSDRTAIAVIGIDQGGNKYLLDGVRHRMKLSDRWSFLRNLYAKWSNHKGVQFVKVGYERYGQQSDLEVIEEYQDRERFYFPIEEVNTPRQGGHSKNDRIERLEPDIRRGIFYFPAIVYHADFADVGGVATWRPWCLEDADAAVARSSAEVKHNIGDIVYRPLRGLTKIQRTVDYDRIVSPIKHLDENNKVYDLTQCFIEEYRDHPFAQHDDLIDALSRIYDMEPASPINFDAKALEGVADDEFGFSLAGEVDLEGGDGLDVYDS